MGTYGQEYGVQQHSDPRSLVAMPYAVQAE